MEEKLLKFTAVFLVVLTIFVCTGFPLLPRLHTWEVEAREERVAEAEFAAEQTGMEKLEILDGGDSGVSYAGQLSLKLPEGTDGGRIEIRNDYVTQTIRIVIPGADDSYFDSYPITGSSNHIDALSYVRDGNKGIIKIVTDRVYELETAYDSSYYYFDFLTPQEVYDKVVVIDAGHGGRAPGAIRQGVNEKDIDLAIVLKLKEMMEASEENIGVYYTRTDDSNPTFEQRAQLANKSNADLFISIHNNSVRSARLSNVNGTQVMYSESAQISQRFAQICLEEVTRGLGSENKGLVEGDSIYIIRTSQVPVALIEVGFMTNPREFQLLRTEEYQRQAAEGIHRAILRAFEEGY